MESLKPLLDYLINFVQALPLHSIFIFIMMRVVMKMVGWSFKKTLQLVLLYVLLTFVGDMYGFRVPTVNELISYGQVVVDWFLKGGFAKFIGI